MNEIGKGDIIPSDGGDVWGAAESAVLDKIGEAIYLAFKIKEPRISTPWAELSEDDKDVFKFAAEIVRARMSELSAM